ncbi:MAG: outer membrane beta-barrel protein [Bacteroidales bacterium]|nr:outer membrane beta-barrel protein [Bacteroidales bacterium]
MKKYILTLLALCLFLTGTRAQDADSLKIKPVTLGVLAQANYAGEDMFISEINLSAYPGFGFEIGAFIDYHITRRLAVEVQAIVGLQNGSYITTDKDLGFLFWHKRPVSDVVGMRMVGLDIPIYLVYGLPSGNGHFNFGAGIFTHITFDAWCPKDKGYVTPYKRVLDTNDVTGKPRYYLNDSHAGVGCLFGYEFASGLQINLSVKYSVLDIINYESAKSYGHPYKVSMGLGWRF